MLMKNNFQSKVVPRGTRTIWRYLGALFLLFTFAIGQMWGDVYLIGRYTLTDGNFTGGSYTTYGAVKSTDGTTLAASSDVSYASSPTAAGLYYLKNNTIAESEVTKVANWTTSGSSSTYFRGYKFLKDKSETLDLGSLTATKIIVIGRFETKNANGVVTLTNSSAETIGTINNNSSNGTNIKANSFEGTYSGKITIANSNHYDYRAAIYVVTSSAPASAAPTITAQPSTSAAEYQKDATATALSVSATGSGTLTYQWYKNSSASTTGATAIDGATSASYTPSTAAAGTLYYYCAVTNTESGKSGTTVNSNMSGAVTVTWPATGAATITYNVKVGTSQTTLAIDNMEATSSSISNLVGFAARGDLAIQTGGGKAASSPKIETPATKDDAKYVDVSFKVAEGKIFTISSVNTKIVAVSHKCSLEVVLSDGVTTESLKYEQGTNGDPGDNHEFEFAGKAYEGTVTLKMYAYGAEASSYRIGKPLTISGTVAVKPSPSAPTITDPSADQEAEYELNATISPLTITATGYPAPTYQWYKNSTKTTEGATAISGAQSASYTPANDVASDWYYYCIASNASGSATSPYFHVTVNSCTKPGTPANLAAGSITFNSAALSWVESANADGYQISIIKKDDESVILDWKASASNSYAATGLAQGTEYTFKVKAVGATGYCEFGDEASADFTTGTPSVADLVEISEDWTFTPSAALTKNTLYEGGKIISLGDGNGYSSNGLQIKRNRPIAFKLANNAKVKITFTENGTKTMELGDALTTDKYATYASSATSPMSYTFTTGGVVYLTANDQLYMKKLEIFYPHAVTYALNGGTGTLPTEGAHYSGDKFNLHDGETDITAPEEKEFAGWNDGTTTYGGSAEYTMGAAAVTLTAQWATPLPAPTITFNNGNYTIAGAALDLSTLFSSNSDGAVTYTVKTAGETGAAIDGTNFSATAAGSAVVTATQAATASYKTKSVDATITISAPSEIDGIKLVEDGVLTGNFRTSASLKDQERTIKGITYSKYINLSSRSSWGSQPAGPDNYLLQYTLTKKTNTFYFYAYNKNSGGKSIKVYIKEEGENVVTKTVDIPAGKGDLLSCEVNVTKNAEVLISHTSTDVQICQVVVVESGDELLLAPAVNYNISFNKGRLTAKQNTAKTFEGMTYCNNADYKIDNSGNLKLTTRGTHYVSFEIPTGQTRQLQVTTGGGAYNVSKVLGDDKKATVTGNNNINLGAGIWYINPQGSDVTITNLKFVAAPASMTIAFDSKGGSDVESQLLFVGDKVTEPSPAPTKDDHRLLKWQKGGADYDFDTELVAGDAPGFTLDAVWQETVTITFDPNNTEATFTRTADKGAKIATGDIPADPTYAGYDFQGWTTDLTAEPIVHVDLSATTFSEATTLKAHWEVAQTDASLSALSYNGNAIDVNSAEDVSGVQTYTVHLPWGSTVDPALISVTPTASTATKSSITYNNEEKQATFQVTSGNGTVTINYAIQFVIDAKRGTSIVKAVVSGGDQKAGFAATGIYGDKGYAYTRNNKKLDTADKFVGVKLISGKTFATGDKLFVVTSTDADMGYIEIYEEAEGTNLIKATGVRDASEGIEVPELAGYSEFYIVRKASTGDQAWNGFVDYVEVTREMNPAIKSFKFGDDAATINESAKTITYEVAYGTAVTALTPTVEAYGNNGATYTPAGATDFTSPVVYTVTDAYNELHTDYTVTVNIAAPSTNAYLASLSVAGYALDFDKEEETYNIVLDYGTTVLPEITYAVEDAGLATADKVEGGVNGATTITVTPQAGVGYEKVYTINFSVSTTPKIVIYDGSTTMNIAETGSLAGFTWSIKDAKSLEKSSKDRSFDGKSYPYFVNLFGSATKGVNDGNTRYIEMTVPEGYVAKFRLVGGGNGEGSRSLFISKTKGGTLDPSIAYATTSSADYVSGMSSALQLPGTYYLCCDNSIRLCELSVQLYPIDVTRAMTQGRFGTICYPNGGYLVGAMLLEIAYFDPDQKKIFFDEVIGGKMIAGAPYLFLPNEGVDKFAITYTDNLNAEAGHHNGLYGSYTQEALPADGNHYIMLNNQYCKVVEANTYVGANRAYILLDKIGNDPVAPAYGRRRVSMSVNTKDEAQGFENLQSGDQPMKVMIDGTLYIIRGEKVFDATGRLVK